MTNTSIRYCVRKVSTESDQSHVALTVGIVCDLGLLVVFKYGAFLLDNANQVVTWLGVQKIPVPHLALPIGISFFTFHKISYKIDVYRGTAAARRGFAELLLYILLFPQLIAGARIQIRSATPFLFLISSDSAS